MSTEQTPISAAELDALIAERDTYKADISLTTQKMKMLLKDLGIISENGEMEFSMKRLARNVTPLLMNTSRAEERFRYLGELGAIIEKYGKG